MSRARDIASNKTITYSITEPSNPRTGDLWISYDGDDALSRFYDGSDWIFLNAAV
jgi:hypothetical protein